MTGAPAARRKHRASSSEDSTRDYASPSPDTQRPGKQQIRHRASVACASCRERRIRCVVPPGHTECAQCSRTGTECIIKNDDERRRPISKAYMSSLSNRIALLEGMLKERGVVPPPAVHPPKTRQEAARQQEEQQQVAAAGQAPDAGRAGSVDQPPTPPSSIDEEVLTKLKREGSVGPMHTPQLCLMEPSLLDFEPKHDSDVRYLLSPQGRLFFDQSAGRVRFFGSTANIHVYAESSCPLANRDAPEQTRKADRAIRALGSATHDYLMACFWDHFNTTHQIVDQATFEADRVSQDPKFYSPFLHMAMLAGGYRFADRTRDDVRRLTLGNWESSLHREAKAMIDMELEKPGDVSSVQALLILADLECGVGRDTQGWMYSGMANRLAYDIGLHVSCTATISETERRVRCQVMTACVMMDRQLSVFLGRPTGIMTQDVGVEAAPKEYSLEAALFGDFTKPALNDGVVHRHLMELLALAGSVTDTYNLSSNPAEAAVGLQSRYLQAITLDRQLQNWYRCLPSHLAWNPTNVKAAPLSYFLLHQQFHVCMILLHRPWARYGPTDGVDGNRYPSPASSGSDAGFSSASFFGAPQVAEDDRVSLARSTCTHHAIRIARIFWQHRQRFDCKKIGLVAVQHAGTAALALMGALAHQSKELDHQSNLRYLQVLSSAIYDMSQTYHPAARMYHLLKSMLVDIRKEMVQSRPFDTDLMMRQFRQSVSAGMTSYPSNPWGGSAAVNMYPVLPVIQETATDAEYVQVAKKRRLSERRPSELELTSQSLFGNFTYPSPPNTSQSQSALTEKEESVPPTGEETFDFDFDFLSGTVVDLNHPAEVDVSEPKPVGSPAPEVPSEESEKQVEAAVAEDAPPAPELKREVDESPEMTIEEWLSEPRGITPQQGGTDTLGKDSNSEMDWMTEGQQGEERDGMGLKELVQSVETAVEEKPARRFELDFLRI
ncbi:fungal-specific transcription factor [Echria macrotheca]|uniref:Fungal-specific transcription factor n=1 Tax=Echria macrotheca TaxID=438768 RepID=A0AAJ0BBP3_9PEZI|nr:fungal-specific transcription factor [Echria macrotheca]